ncbi:unnamed protein product [Cunninghamella echinulata]
MDGSNSDIEKNDEKTPTIDSFTEQLQQFDFKDDAIDTALRKLLARVHLPKEAQQIDRAIENFAKHYYTCNPTLSDNSEPIYAVAFSILLLHTDAHNKNVKRKMDKNTFIMNTREIDGGENIPSEVLDVMYDNIVSSEFTYAHDQQDKSTTSWFAKKTLQPTNILLQDYYPKLEQSMPNINQFNYKLSTKTSINIANIHTSIENAQSIRLAGVRSRQQELQQYLSNDNETSLVKVYKAGILDRKYDLAQGGKRATARGWRPFGMILSGSQLMFFGDIISFQSWLVRAEDGEQIKSLQQQQQAHYDNDNHLTSPTYPPSTMKHQTSYASTSTSTSTSSTSSPTSEAAYSTLNSSQSILGIHSSNTPIVQSSATSLISPRTSTSSVMTTIISTSTTASGQFLRPLQIVSLMDAICLYDDSYKKYPYVFRLITHDGQQFLIRGESEDDVDDWVQKINYVSTMKTAGVKLRSKTIMTQTENNYYYQRNNQYTSSSSSSPSSNLLPGMLYQPSQNNFTSPQQQQQSLAKRIAKAKSKVISLSENIVEKQRQLKKEERLRNHLLVLIPLQKITKDRILAFSEMVGKRLIQQRISLQKLECYREYIEKELFIIYQSDKINKKKDHGNQRKLSAPLPFYSGLLQVRCATAPPMQHHYQKKNIKSPVLDPTIIKNQMNSNNDNANSNNNNNNKNMQHDTNNINKNNKNPILSPVYIPNRTSSLIVALPETNEHNNNSNENDEDEVDDDATINNIEHQHEKKIDEKLANGSNNDSENESENENKEGENKWISRRLSCPHLQQQDVQTTVDHSTENQGDDNDINHTCDCNNNNNNNNNNNKSLSSMISISTHKSNKDDISSNSYKDDDDTNDKSDRLSRRRSQSNPSPLHSIRTPFLQVPIKKNRDRSASDVTTDDEDFSIVISHDEQDSLVNNIDHVN